MGVPDEIWDHNNQDDFGIWTCLIATKVASLLTQKPNFSLQNPYLRLTATKNNITIKGRKVITKSIEHGTIKNTQESPFCNLRIERKDSQERSAER